MRSPRRRSRLALLLAAASIVALALVSLTDRPAQAQSLPTPTVTKVTADIHSDGTGRINATVIRASSQTLQLLGTGIQLREPTTAAWPMRYFGNNIPSGAAVDSSGGVFKTSGLKLCTTYEFRLHALLTNEAGNQFGAVEASSPVYRIPTPCTEVPEENLEAAGKAGIYIAEAQKTHTIPEGGSFTYGIKLRDYLDVTVGHAAFQPTADVTVTPTAVGDHAGLLDLGEAVTFTADDWAGYKYVTVTAPDDNYCGSPPGHKFFVTHTIVSTDPNYDMTDDEQQNQWRNWSAITFEITDNDDCTAERPPLIVSPASLSVTEGGASVTYTIKLRDRINTGHQIYPQVSDSSAVSVTPGQDFWDTYKQGALTFTVTALEDTDAVNETVTITHRIDAVSSILPLDEYVGGRVTVTVIDDDGSGGTGPQIGRIARPQDDPGDSGAEPQRVEAPNPAPDWTSLIPQMWEWRNDPQWVSYKSHTDRWDRALLALGETIDDASLTPMSAAEAQGYADESWGARWVPVAAAIRFVEQGGQRDDEGVTSGGTLEVPDTNENQPPQGTPLGQSEPEPDAQQPAQQDPEPQGDSQPQQQAPQQPEPAQQPQQTPQQQPANPSCDGTLTLQDITQAVQDMNAGAITRAAFMAIMKCWDKQRGL